MVPVVSGFLFCGWLVLVWLLFQPKQSREWQIQFRFNNWKITKKEFFMMFVCVSIVVVALSIVLKNPLLLGAGFVTGVYFPPFLLERRRYKNRLNSLASLTDPLHLLVSRLPDQQNLTRAIEITRDETNNPNIRDLFDRYIKDVSISGSTREALLSLGKNVGWRKFDVFIENLLLAHYEGFTCQALTALSKSIEVMEGDLRAIETVRIQSGARKKKLYTALGITWLFPFILSLSNTGQNNIYLDTWPGKVLVFLYAVCTLYIYINGEEYLRLRLDEL